MSQDPDQLPAVYERLPAVVAKAVIKACVRQIPLASLAVDVVEGVATVRNEAELIGYLDLLASKIQELEQDMEGIQDSLRNNRMYQVAVDFALSEVNAGVWTEDAHVDRLRNAALNLALLDDDEVEKQAILWVLRRMSPLHVVLLEVHAEIVGQQEVPQRDDDDVLGHELAREAERRLRYRDFYTLQSDLVRFGVLRDVIDNGFIEEKEQPFLTPIRASDFGHRVLKVLRDPVQNLK